MKSSYINFVLTGDNNYVAPLGVCMTSIVLNLAEDKRARFFLFVEGFTKDDMNRLEDVKKVRPCEIIFVKMEDYKHLFSCIDTSKFVLKYVNLVVYYRLLMLDILPNDVDKCFYIDGDMIIDSDLSYLYDKFDEKNIMGAVVEILAMQYRDSILKHFMEWKDLKNFQNNPLKYPYFNAGFFLLNVKKAKELELFKRAFEFLENHPNPPYADQDTLNYIVGQTYPHLLEHFPPSYNVFCDMHHDIDLYYDAFYDKKEIQEAFNHPKIYHYGGANKPWINRKVRFFYSIWWRYCHLSPWADLPEPEADNIEELDYTKSNFENLNEFKEFKFSNNMCSTYKLFNFIPIFKKKIKNKEKKYYILGIRFFSKKQVTPYMKHYRVFGIKFKKINIQKMVEFKTEDIKMTMNWKFDSLLNTLSNSLSNTLSNSLSNTLSNSLSNTLSNNLSNTLSYQQDQGLDVKLRNLKAEINNFQIDRLVTKENLCIQLQELKKKIDLNNSVFITHQKTFLPYKNIFDGREIVILATGPSLNQYVPIPNVIHIGVNNAYKFNKVNLDFLFIQDISGLKEEISNINHYGQGRCQKFYGDVLSMETCAIPESYLIKYGAKRYYTGGMHSPFIRDISSCLLPDFGSVIFSALAFALYTNPKRIYLVGCDCSDTGYFDDNKNSISSSLKGDLPNILQGWQNFKTFANHLYPNTEIISVNPVGLKGVFQDIEVK